MHATVHAVQTHGWPEPMYSFNSSGWYWVSTPTVSIPELTQLDSGKSMMRYFPPYGTAGLAMFLVNTYSRLPCPPANSWQSISFSET